MSEPSSNNYSFFNKRTIFILITAGIVIAYIGISSFLCNGWIAAAILSFGVYAVIWAYAFYNKDQRLIAILLMATIAGFLELFADKWLVETTNKLFYEKGEPMLLDSPAYMPFSWAVILTQFAVITDRIRQYWNMLWAVIAGALLGGMLIPFFEHCAKGACWWSYSDWQHEFWNTPYFIILGEALIGALLPIVALKLTKPLSFWVLLAGVIVGLWIWGAYYISYQIFDL